MLRPLSIECELITLTLNSSVKYSHVTSKLLALEKCTLLHDPHFRLCCKNNFADKNKV